KATHTEAMIATMASGAVHIISHPGNPKYPVDIPAIAAAAAKYQVALEINNSSFVSSRVGSEDNCRAVAAAVRDAGGWVALGSDSHTAFTLGEFKECRKILDDVNFPEERILNVSPRRLLNFLESRGMPAIPEFADL
ncbi:TPA: phosphatase, partial [Raoultella ornithinolytica]